MAKNIFIENDNQRDNDLTFDFIWDHHKNDIENFIRSKVNNVHDAEDILQDVFIKVYRNLNKLRKVTSINAWLFTISNNSIIDYYKKKKPHLVMPHELYDIEEASIEDNNYNNEFTNCIKETTFDIPDKYMKVYKMFEEEGLKHKDIMKKLNISLSTSKIRLMRAREKMAESINKCCELESDGYGNVINLTLKEEGKKHFMNMRLK